MYFCKMRWFILFLLPTLLWGQQPAATLQTEVVYDPEIGEIVHQRKMQGGVLHGLQREIRNGFIYKTEVWDNGKLVGPVELYYATGTLKERYYLDEDGLMHGPCERYYVNTRPLENNQYVHGELAPHLVRTYYPNSRLAMVRNYRDCEGTTPTPQPADSLMPALGRQYSAYSRDSLWQLFTYQGVLWLQRSYSCGQIEEEKILAENPDTLVYGTNSWLSYFVKKNIVVQIDTSGDPLVIKMKGKFGRYKDIERPITYNKYVNQRLTETYYISRRYQQETWKTYYENRRTASLRIHKFGAYTQEVRTFYANAKLKEQFTIDLAEGRLGLYRRYWPNGQLMTEGYYSQDSTTTADTLAVGSDPELQVEVLIYTSARTGTWRHYDHNGVLLREEELP